MTGKPGIRRTISFCLTALVGLSSCATSANLLTLKMLNWVNLKGSSLARVRAGKSFVDEASTQARPDAAFLRWFSVRSDEVEGHPVFTISPKNAPSTKTVLYLHGGAYSVTFTAAHWAFFGKLIDGTNCSIVAPDYPLPPDSDWKASWAVVEAVYAGIVAGGASGPILMGDSAGGGFALALAEELSTAEMPRPQKLVLLSPWLDITMTNPGIAAVVDKDPILSVEALRLAGRRWAGDTDPADWHLSPLYGPVEGLPPIALFTGTADVLNPDARTLRDRLAALGRPCDYREFPDMVHVGMMLGFPGSAEARAQVIEMIKGAARETEIIVR